MTRERDVEKYLVNQVKAAGGEVRKVKWIGRVGAPDRLVMLPPRALTVHLTTGETREVQSSLSRSVWVELKAPGKKATFPADARERAQSREHKRMRAMGQRVVVIDSKEGVNAIFE